MKHAYGERVIGELRRSQPEFSRRPPGVREKLGRRCDRACLRLCLGARAQRKRSNNTWNLLFDIGPEAKQQGAGSLICACWRASQHADSGSPHGSLGAVPSKIVLAKGGGLKGGRRSIVVFDTLYSRGEAAGLVENRLTLATLTFFAIWRRILSGRGREMEAVVAAGWGGGFSRIGGV